MCISLCKTLAKNKQTKKKTGMHASVVMSECEEFNSADGKHYNFIVFKLL